MNETLTFTHPELQAKFDESGYVVTPLLNKMQIARLNEVFRMHFDMDTLPQVFHSISVDDTSVIRQINKGINEILSAELPNIISGYRILGSIFFVKKPGDDSELGLHFDTSFTIEPYKCVGIWIPLSDIDESNGRFCLIEGSHNFHAPYNTSGMPWVYGGDAERILSDRLTCLSMKAGEALIMNNNILHATQKNSSIPRIAVVLKVIDASAPLVTVYYDENAEIGKQVSLYEQDFAFCTSDDFRMSSPPHTARFIGHKPELPRIITAAEVAELLEKNKA